MDQPKDSKSTDGGTTPAPPSAPETPIIPIISASATPSIVAAKSELPVVESPSISPADLVSTGEAGLAPASMPIPPLPADEAAAATETTDAPASAAAPATHPRFALRPRHKRYAVLAASVAIAAALGGVIGALASGGFSKPEISVAVQEESKAMRQSVARLAKEVTTLKASLEDANKFARAQVAKLDAKIDTKVASKPDVMRESAEITGSISAPQTIAAAPSVPMPVARPAPRIAAAESQLPARQQVVPGWSIRDARGGYVYVEGHGDIYQIVPGAPLPGLGPVESVKRLGGRWVVTTPKGIIVSMRDRRYFE